MCRQAFSDALGENLSINVFNWSGANTPGARLRAAAMLATLLKDLKARHPQSLIHIAAHSHGGNVVLYAARDPEVAAMISSVACLSTPFLHIAPREFGPWLAQKLKSTANFFAFIAVASIVAVCIAILALRGGWNIEPAPLGMIELGAGATIGTLVVRRLRHRWRLLYERSRRYAKSLELPSILPFPVLLIRGAADEAASALGFVQLLSTLLSRILRLLTLFVPTRPFLDDRDPSTDHRQGDASSVAWLRLGNIGAALAIGALGIELIYFLANGHVQWPRWLTLVVAGHDVSPTLPPLLLGVILASIGPLLFVLAAPCILLLTLAMALALFPYGPRFALAGMSLLLSAEATPPGQWVLTQLPPSAAPLQDDGAFSHGTHSDAGAMTILRRWLSENLIGRPS